MKERNRIFAILLAIMMVFTYMPGLAYAAAGDEPDPDVTVESQEEATVEEPVQEEPAEASEPAEAAEPAETKAPVEATEPESENEEPAKAEAAHGKLSAAGSAKMVPDAKIADNDELFEQYFSSEVDKALGQSVQKRGAKSPRANNLNDTELYIYSQILMMMQDIANAKVSRAVVSIDLKDQLGDYLVDTGDEDYPWGITSKSLGLESYEWVCAPDEEGKWGLSDVAREKLFDIGKVVDALLLDQPYYAFWFDKKEGFLPEFNVLIDTSGEGSDAFFAEEPNLTLSFSVAEAYRAADGDEYDVDSEKAESTVAAVVTVEKIVAENSGEKDLDKLYAYKNKICDLTSYDNASAANPETPYGDPWQLISVFDGNEDTKAVCEGYSKAFQFLCDKSSFVSEEIDCNTVTGYMIDDGGEPEDKDRHMWNILHMDDGRNYLADITNCDNDNPEDGYPDDLFLKGYTGGSVDDGYNYAEKLTYKYDDEAFAQYDYDDLTMSAYDYGEEGSEGGDEDDDDDAVYDWEGPYYFYSNGDAEFTLPEEAVIPDGCTLDLRVGVNSYDPDDEDHGWQETFTEGSEYDFDKDTMTLTLHGEAIAARGDIDDGERISFFAGVIVDEGSGWLASGYSEYRYVDVNIASIKFSDADGRGSEADPIKLVENNGGYWDWEKDDPDDRYYIYEVEEFKSGDIVTVIYKDGSEKSFAYDNDEGVFYDNNGNSLDYWPEVTSGQGKENRWLLGDAEPHTATVMIAGHEITVYYKVVENPVKSVSFKREGGVKFREGFDGVNSDGGDESFIHYWLDFRAGDTLTVTVQEEEGKDPVEKVYVGVEEDEDGAGDSTFRFVNTTDETDCLYYRDIDVASDEQSAANEWKYPDTDHWFTVEYMGVVSEHIKVEMLENPVSKFEFSRSGGVILTEGVDGDYDGDYDEETEEYVEYFEYYFNFRPGDQIRLYDSEGMPSYYEAVPEEEGSRWVSRFVRRYDAGTGDFDENDYIEAYRFDYEDQPSQNKTHWLAGGEGYSFILYFSGHQVTVPVTTVENPVESISFSREGYDEEHPIQLIDQIDGWYCDDEFRFDLIFKEGDVLTVDFGDAAYDYIYTISEDDNPDEFVLSDEYSDVPEDVPQAISSNDVYTQGEDPDEDEPWRPGEGHRCYIFYSGRSCGVDVVPVENPVENISFERDGYSKDDPIELKEGGDYSYEEDGVTKYVCPLEDGDRLIVTKGGNDTVYEFVRIHTGDAAEDTFVNVDDPDDVLEIPWDVWWDSAQSKGEEWYAGDRREFTLNYMGATCSIYVKIVEGSDGPDIPDDQIVTTLHPESDGSVRTIVSDEMSDEMNFPENGDSITVDGVTYTYDSASDSFKNGSDEVTWRFWGTDSDYDEDAGEYTFYFIVEYRLNGEELGKSWIETVYGNEILGIEFIPNGRTELNAADIQDGDGGYDISKRGNGSFFIEGDTIKLTNEFNGKTTVYEFTYNPDSTYHDFHCDGYGDAPTYARCENPVIGNNTVQIDMLGGRTTTVIRIVDGGAHTHSPVKIAAKDATCTEQGNIEYWYCEGCGKYFSDEQAENELTEDEVFTAIDPDAHDWDDVDYTWSEDNSSAVATRICKINPLHIETAQGTITIETTKPATEEADGEALYTAKFSAEWAKTQTKTVVIPKTTHKHEPVQTAAKAANCTEQGNSAYWYCEGCNKYFSDEACTNEIAKDSWVINALGHEFGDWEPHNADQHKRVCTREGCGETEYAAHTWDDGKIVTEPTETAPGKKIFTCTVCKGTKEEEIPPLTVEQMIEKAEKQADDADGKATAVENSTDEGAISDAEVAAVEAAAYASMVEAAAEKAYKEATPEQKETAAKNLAEAKKLVAAANSAVAKTKKAAAKVAANKAAAAYSAAQSAATSAAAEKYLKDAEAYATTAAEKADAADTASANAAKAVSDLENLAKEMADSSVAGDINAAKSEASTAAGTASDAATAADKAKDNAKESAGNAKTAVNNKKTAELDAKTFYGIADKKIKKVKGLKKSKMTKTAITVKWTKLSKKNLGGATKYEVWACPNKGFKKADTKVKTFSKGKSSGKVSGLKKNTKYFVRVRAIKVVGGVKYVGPWSSTKGIKTKK